MLGGLFKRVVLAVAVAVVALTASESQAQVDGEPNMYVYSDAYVRIVIVGEWVSASETNKTVTFFYPAEDRVRVTCECTQRGWEAVSSKVDDRVNGGFVELKVKCLYNSEATHEVKLKFRAIGKIDFDLDCDADWDGDIDDDDDPIEDLTGALVGVHKLAPIELKLDYGDADPTNCTENGTVSIELKGGISLCSTNGGVVKVIVEAPQMAKEPVKKELTLKEVGEITSVRGEEVSGKFADCEVKATLNLPGEISAEDLVRYTVVDVGIIIDGKSSPRADKEKGKEGKTGENEDKLVKSSDAFALYVNDAGASPFSARATNYLVNVGLKVYPCDFPTNLQEQVEVLVDGDVENYLYEQREEFDERGQIHYSYVQAENKYNMLGLSTNVYVLHGHQPSAHLRDRKLTLEELKTHVQATNTFTVVKLNLVPDYDRDHSIGEKDEENMCQNKKLYWWVNDDSDKYDCGSCYEGGEYDIPGKNKNNSDNVVNRSTDILDFFPVWVDAKNAMDLFDADGDAKLVLDSNGYGIVYTKLTTYGGLIERTPTYLSGNHKTADDKYYMWNAATDHDSSRELKVWQPKFALSVRSNAERGILMVEGRRPGAKMELRVEKNSETLVRVELPVDIFGVEEMYNQVHISSDGRVTKKEFQMGDYFTANTDVIYLHGFKVSSENARGWHSDMFKRLYQSGSNARFWGVTWDGFKDPFLASPGQYYHTMAGEVAFTTAKHLKPTFAKSQMRGNVVVMAHSLGNMVVSSAIVDNGWRPDRYFMLNAAVPVEAYLGRSLAPSDKETAYHLIHKAWREKDDPYPAEAFCSNWYRLFNDNSAERPWQKLTWVNRFAGISEMTSIVNYYSDGDEVFEIEEKDGTMLDGVQVVADDTNIEGTPGTIWTMEMVNSFAQFCWQKQELAKGLAWSIESPLNPLFDSSWCGWKFDKGYGRYVVENGNVVSSRYVWLKPWEFYCRKFSAETAREIVRVGLQSFFKEHPVFDDDPEGMFNFADPSFVTLDRDQLLGFGIPALSPALGRPYEAPQFGEAKCMPTICKDLNRCWRSVYETRWLHCDLKDMAYCHNYLLYDDFVKNGGMKK